MLGLDETRLPAVGGSEVDQPQMEQHLPHQRHIAGRNVIQIEVHQRDRAACPAVLGHLLDQSWLPLTRSRLRGEDEERPLDLRPQQRRQPMQIYLSWPAGCGRLRAPCPELLPVPIADTDCKVAALEPVPPGRGQQRTPRPALTSVALLVPVAQTQRRIGQVGADGHPAGAVAGELLLFGEPALEARALARGAGVALPPKTVPLAQPRQQVRRGPLRTHPADGLPGPHGRIQPSRVRHERGLADAVRSCCTPLPAVLIAHIPAADAGPLAALNGAAPPVDRMITREPDQPGAIQRVERRGADQGGHQLQPVPHHPVIIAIAIVVTGAADDRQRQQLAGGHRCSPHTLRSAASNAGSCTSTCA